MKGGKHGVNAVCPPATLLSRVKRLLLEDQCLKTIICHFLKCLANIYILVEILTESMCGICVDSHFVLQFNLTIQTPCNETQLFVHVHALLFVCQCDPVLNC